MKYRIISQKDIEDEQEEYNILLKENCILQRKLKDLEKMIFPYELSSEPQILNINNDDRLQLHILFNIGEYKSPSGNHVIVRDYIKNKTLQFSYYADDIGMNEDLKIKLIERFITELLENK